MMMKALYIHLNCSSHSDFLHNLDWHKYGVHWDRCEHDGDALMDLLQETPYSLAMINLNGNLYRGLECCRQIRQQHHFPIIVIEDSLDFMIIRKALKLRVSDYLPSTLPAEELMQSVTKVCAKHKKHKDDIIHQVKKYVNQRLHKNITLKEISDRFHFNRSYLGQKFKLHENMSFNEYLFIQRMERAKWLLANTELKVYEIAGEVGYTEIDWFYKRFKAYTGVSANEYRKRVAS